PPAPARASAKATPTWAPPASCAPASTRSRRATTRPRAPTPPTPAARAARPAASYDAPATQGSIYMKISYVVAVFNYDITSRILVHAKAHAEFLGEENGPVVRPAGVFDPTLPSKILLKRKDVDAVV